MGGNWANFKSNKSTYLSFAGLYPSSAINLKEKEKMHLSTNLAKAIVIVLALLMASTSLMALQVNAQTTVPANVTPTNLQSNISIPLPAGVTPDVSVNTNPGLSFRPNPVGLGQSIVVNVWIGNVATHAARQLGIQDNDF